MDNIIEVNKEEYLGLGCDLSKKNLEYWQSEDQEFYNKITEHIYRRQLIGNSGFTTQQIEEINLIRLKKEG